MSRINEKENWTKLKDNFNKRLAELSDNEIRFADVIKTKVLEKKESTLSKSQKELQKILFSALQISENNM